VEEVFFDNDVSACSGRRRPAFKRMVKGIKAGVLDAIVVWHPDRVTRSTKELESVIDLVELNERPPSGRSLPEATT
jgi:DNA invertase Pin-like site-specific DNA recombinase